MSVCERAFLDNKNICHLFSKPKEMTATASAKSLQSCLTLCDPTDGSPPGSTMPGILQARTLEWVAISFSLKLVTVKNFYFSRTEQEQPKKHLSLSLFVFLATQCGTWILLPQAGPELRSPALGVTSPKPWTAREALQ